MSEPAPALSPDLLAEPPMWEAEVLAAAEKPPGEGEIIDEALATTGIWGPLFRPGLAMTILLIGTFATQFHYGGALAWGLSARALAEGRVETLVLHMFAHGGIMHIIMNLIVLFFLSAAIMMRVGLGLSGWGRWFALYLLGGAASAAMFLALNPFGTVPMVGASGAICALLGALARQPNFRGTLAPVLSRPVWEVAWPFIKGNAFLFVFLYAVTRSVGAQGGLAWEAHLGGFLLGLLAAPLFLPEPAPLRPCGAPPP